MNLDIDKDDNADYFNIIETEHGNLMDRWNELHYKLYQLKIPKVFGFKAKKELKDIGKALKDLQKDYLEWNKKAGNFLGKPRYNFNKEQDGLAIFIHYSSMLRHVVNTMHNNMVMIVDSFNKRIDQRKSQINFNIAIVSFALTFLGLVFTLYTIFYK